MRSTRDVSQTIVLTLCLLAAIPASTQTPPEPTTPYSLSVSVNEVKITFHALDAHNLPVLDLRPVEIDVFDNESGPGQILDMQLQRNRPIHAGFLIDTSGSTATQLWHSRLAAQEAVRTLLSGSTDSGAAIEFRRSRNVAQGWTNRQADLMKAIDEIGTSPHTTTDGTALYDTLLSTCLYEFGKPTEANTANAILLFSDGEDTASHTSLPEAIDRCRKSHTAIYAFGPKPAAGTSSSGPSTLRKLTEETGGRFFFTDNSGSTLPTDLATINADLRDEYTLYYRPKKLLHDGAFHKIILVGPPKRVTSILGTSGYYAPAP